MIEMLALLRAKGFTNFIATGGSELRARIFRQGLRHSARAGVRLGAARQIRL
jgi:hypothetical protein